jgi:hypothetical protein
MTYSVYWYDADGNQYTDCQYVSQQEAMQACQRLAYGPARMLVKEIKCTDALDCLVWHVRDNIVWPDDPNPTALPPTTSQSTPTTDSL